MLPYAAPHTVRRSPRYLVLDRAREAVAKHDNIPQPPLPGTGVFETLAPGFVRLYSHFEPELKGGAYAINAKQEIATSAGESIRDKLSTQNFTVVAPQFQLPQGAVHSAFPAQGQAVPVETLPHIVFTDPHLPWAREAIEEKKGGRNKTPWLALLVFTPDELSLKPEELDGPSSLFADCKKLNSTSDGQSKAVKQTATQAIRLAQSDILSVKNLTNACQANDDTDVDDPAFDTIFMRPSLFKELVRTYEAGIPLPDEKMKAPDLTRYKFLSHVRNTNTEGTAESGGGMGMGVFSVIISHRTGPVDDPKPAPVVAHLVSLEGIAGMTWPISGSSYVALPSLYSWAYTSLPSGSFNIADKFKHIGNTIDCLRPSASLLAAASAANHSASAKRIWARLGDGYTITRHRVQTGEVTTSMLRGPLVPTTSNQTPSSMNKLSNAGTDLQVLDQNMGLMDITYSIAWQLGKTLAITDQNFCAALNRLRTVVQRLSMNRAKVKISPTLNLAQTVQSVPGAIRDLVALNDSNSTGTTHRVLDRWSSTVEDTVDLSLSNGRLVREFEKATRTTIAQLAASADDDGKALFNELNKPTSTDWMTVLGWIMDRKFLAGIPAHYLILDPSFLPQESLRFFYIDQSWMDAMIDGSLSIGNHLESHDDKIRAAIKSAINAYCAQPISELERPPQIPSFGFLLRSDLVAQFPDLRITPVFEPPLDPSCAPILRHENIDTDVMLCLFDRYPGPGSHGGLKEIHITQPPHQQSFTIGEKLDEHHLEPAYRRIYTDYDGSDKGIALDAGNQKYSYKVKPAPALPSGTTQIPPQEPPTYIWGEDNEIRTLVFPHYADDLLERLQTDMPKKSDGSSTFTDDQPTAAMVGIALNDSCYELVITLNQDQPNVPQPHVLSMMEAWSEPPLLSATRPSAKRLIATSTQPSTTLPKLDQRPELDTTEDKLAPDSRTVYEMSDVMRKAVLGAIGSPNTDSQLLNKPNFAYKIYPIAYDPVELNAGKHIPTNAGSPQDLVFSIVLAPGNLQSNLHLKEIQFIVPMGPKSKGNYLLREFDGPAPVMLSNLRFNVLVERMEESLLLRLVPRTTAREGVHWRKVKEAGFVLSLVEVTDFESDHLVFVQYAEKYFENDEWFRKWMTLKVFPTKQR